MTINGISNAGSILGTDVDPSTLSADSLLSYCSASLNGLDSQIKERMADQQASTAQQKAAGDLIALYQTWNAGVPAKGGSNEFEKNATQGMAAGLIAQYSNNTDPTLQSNIKATYKAVTGNDMVFGANGQPVTYDAGKIPINGDSVKQLTNEQWQQMTVTPAKQAQDSLSKGADMAMIEIQSLVSKRQLCIQLTTQIMQAENDGTKGITGNIGH